MKKIFVATLLLGVFNSYTLVAYAACTAPAPVDCSVLSASQCQQQTVLYQAEASTYNSCIAVDETCQAPTPPASYYCGERENCDPTDASIAAYKSALTQYNLCVANTSCNSFLPDHATQGYENGSGQCSYNCASGYYLTVSNTCVASPTVTSQTTSQSNPPETQPVATPVPIVTPVVVQVAPTPTPTPAPVPIAPTPKSKSIFTEIAQVVTPKQSVVAPAVIISTTSATNSEPTASATTTMQPSPTPVSFWTKVGSFFAKLNPLKWF